MQLRPYQQAAIDAVYDHLRRRDDNPCAVIPTAGGKTPVMATICKDAVGTWGGRVLILAHVKELLQQTADKLQMVCPEVNFGVYSAGLKRRDTSQSVIVAGIQSVFRRACDLDAFDLIMVDEAHLIPAEGDGMYRRFLADAKVVNPQVRVVGFTATPFRLKTGPICTADGILNHICYEVGVRELIRDGYLCPLVTKAGINVLTTGFDAPHIDSVALVRPTLSPGLYYQMVGRGFRLHPDKQNCLVLDFGGNVLRHGPVDMLQIKPVASGDGTAPAKECPECQALVAAGYSNCPQCGYAFPPPDRNKHDARASEVGILSGQVTDTEYEVIDVVYRIHRKRDAEEGAPRCLRVDYLIGLERWQSEFICIEHSGYARRKAELWWQQRCLEPCPTTAEEALDLADAGLLASAERITVRSIAGEKYDRILCYELTEIPSEALEEAPF